jgi:hypothetical protein
VEIGGELMRRRVEPKRRLEARPRERRDTRDDPEHGQHRHELEESEAERSVPCATHVDVSLEIGCTHDSFGGNRYS